MAEYVQIAPMETRTESFVSKNYTNKAARGLHAFVAVEAVSVSGSLTVSINGHDRISGKDYLLLQSAAIAASGTTVLKVYPGLTAAANTVVSDVLPYDFNVKVTQVGVSAKYGISASIVE